ncbi:MAG: 23S rRNA (adenine(2503)-C(2))-methyltransferase RlmN [Candidatus Spyradocola sp.]|nr:23S rRNA (adenine(2503)-C(2))-methyltransferase RlmN [Candidatus Spyradocola sp.]
MEDCLLGYTLEELTAYLQTLGEKPFRAKQLYGWLHKGADFDEMRNLPAALREKLKQSDTAIGVSIIKTLVSQKDGTEKYLFSLRDGNVVEGVLMRYNYGNTLCISSQVGCRMGCKFCASTLEGRVRDMTAGEMLGEVVAVNRLHAQGDKRGVTNIVMMGSGEPLDNYDNVVRFLRLVSAPEGINISLRNVSVSTCGLADRMDDLAGENLPITLSISLHAPTDEARRRIMPIANQYSIERLMKACRDYVDKVGRRIVFEYALIEGVNTSLEDADRLAALTRGLLCHVNLIPLNDVPERDLRAPGQKGIDAFQKRLESLHVSVTRRREMGADIEGACGQLRRKHLSTEGK